MFKLLSSVGLPVFFALSFGVLQAAEPDGRGLRRR